MLVPCPCCDRVTCPRCERFVGIIGSELPSLEGCLKSHETMYCGGSHIEWVTCIASANTKIRITRPDFEFKQIVQALQALKKNFPATYKHFVNHEILNLPSARKL